MRDGTHVYIIAQGVKDPFLFKVGVARNVEARISQLKTGNPHNLELVECFGFTTRRTAMTIEKEMHRYLAKFRVSGEWFRCTCAEMYLALPIAISVHKHLFGIGTNEEAVDRFLAEVGNGQNPHH